MTDCGAVLGLTRSAGCGTPLRMRYSVAGFCVLCAAAGALYAAPAKPAPKAAPAPKPAAPAPVVPAGPVVVGAQEMSPEHIAALAAGIYQAVSNSITPEVVVAIAAAIRYTLGNEYRILEIKPVTPAFAEAGRAANMTNHFPVRSIVRR